MRSLFESGFPLAAGRGFVFFRFRGASVPRNRVSRAQELHHGNPRNVSLPNQQAPASDRFEPKLKIFSSGVSYTALLAGGDKPHPYPRGPYLFVGAGFTSAPQDLSMRKNRSLGLLRGQHDFETTFAGAAQAAMRVGGHSRATRSRKENSAFRRSHKRPLRQPTLSSMWDGARGAISVRLRTPRMPSSDN